MLINDKSSSSISDEVLTNQTEPPNRDRKVLWFQAAAAHPLWRVLLGSVNCGGVGNQDDPGLDRPWRPVRRLIRSDLLLDGANVCFLLSSTLTSTHNINSDLQVVM